MRRYEIFGPMADLSGKLRARNSYRSANWICFSNFLINLGIGSECAVGGAGEVLSRQLERDGSRQVSHSRIRACIWRRLSSEALPRKLISEYRRLPSHSQHRAHASSAMQTVNKANR